MTLYRRPGSSVWHMDFTVNGRRVRRTTGTAIKAEARIVEAQAMDAARKAVAQPSRWRVRHLAGQYWQGRARHARASATIWYQLKALVDGLGPNTFVADIDAAMLLRYIERRAAPGPNGRRRSNASINRELVALRAAMNYAAEHFDQPIPRIRWKGLMLKEPAGRVRYLTAEEYRRLIAACDPEMALMVMLACSSGLRQENLRQLTWDQVDLLAGTAEAPGARLSVTVKGNKRHQVRLSGQAAQALARLAAEAVRASPGQPLAGPVFRQPNWRRRWDAARKAAGLRDYRWHDHRHTFASWARMAGADIALIRDALAHSSIQMTTRYAHITAETAATAWDAVMQHSPIGAATSQSTSHPVPDADALRKTSKE